MWTKIHHFVMWSSIISWFVVASIYCSNVALYLAPGTSQHTPTHTRRFSAARRADAVLCGVVKTCSG